MTAFNWLRKSGRGSRRSEGFLTRLRRDQRGNTLALSAAALIPMIGMVGSAVDISRAYLVKTRLQQACDAGVLAARRTMAGQSITGDTNAQTQATNFFNVNLRPGAFGATITPIAVTNVTSGGTPTGAVHGTASAVVPTTLMRIFGKTSLAMTAECEAQLQISNNDVMFVLDVTGSMNCAAADTDSTCADNGLVEKTNARIKALRTAVVNFYDTVNAATTSGSQLRIGFMPYSTTVNVGKLLPAAYVSDTHNYQSRVAIFNTQKYVAGTPTSNTNTVETYKSTLTSGECNKYGQNAGYPTLDGASSSTGSQAGGSVTTTTYSFKDWGATGTTTGTSKTCRRNKNVTVTPYTLRYAFTNWDYRQTSYDTTGFKSGSVSIVQSTVDPTVTLAAPATYNELQLAQAGLGLPTVSSSWTGCLEERDTVANATFSSSAMPSNAYDLQIDTLPTSAATRWRPHWDDIIWGKTGSTYFRVTGQDRNLWACPKEASKLAVRTHDDVYNYVNASDFKAVGYTYHDVGMLWGARFVSQNGLFASENQAAPNGRPINRHIIFMTDGDMKPSEYTYSLYGHEALDRRISGTASPSDSELKNRHNSRFSAICELAKNPGNVTIWVVAYAQTMTTELQNCATGNRYYYAANDAALQSAFQNIASQIAQLRLSR
jgi:Flp pilus assembly protein TadG